MKSRGYNADPLAPDAGIVLSVDKTTGCYCWPDGNTASGPRVLEMQDAIFLPPASNPDAVISWLRS